MYDGMKTRGIKYLNFETQWMFVPLIKISDCTLD